jgi:hypothetical protein
MSKTTMKPSILVLAAAVLAGSAAAQSGAQCLYNHHFDAGTFIIDQPGSSYK